MLSRSGCLSEPVSVTIEVLESPEVDVSISGSTECVLPTDQVMLRAAISNGASVSWTGPNGFISTMDNPILVGPTEAQSGLYTATALNAAGCSNSESIVVEFSRGIPQLETFFDGDLCRGETLQLFAEEVTGASYAWTGPNGYTASVQNPVIPSLTPSFGGSYTVVASLPNGCSSTASAPLELDILASPEASADQYLYAIGSGAASLPILSNDLLANSDVQITLTRAPVFGQALVAQDGTLSYTSDTDSPREDRLEYEVCYLACPDQCSRGLVTVNVDFDRAECIATTVITPNGDGENDNFYISCLDDPDQNPQNTLLIYNEWGDEVYQAAPYDNSWEGTYNGADLPDGTYYYLFRASPNDSEQRGFITIYR